MQQGLLKILEGTVSNIPPQGGRKHPEQQYLQVDTTNILFICGGTFSGIEELIKKRVGKQRIGFVDDGKEAGQESAAHYLPLIETEDLLGFGMIPLVAPDFKMWMPHSIHPLIDSGILLATVAAVALNALFNGASGTEEDLRAAAGSAEA